MESMESEVKAIDRETAISDLRVAAHSFAHYLDEALQAGVGPAVILPLLTRVLEEEGIELPPLAAGLLGGS